MTVGYTLWDGPWGEPECANQGPGRCGGRRFAEVDLALIWPRAHVPPYTVAGSQLFQKYVRDPYVGPPGVYPGPDPAALAGRLPGGGIRPHLDPLGGLDLSSLSCAATGPGSASPTQPKPLATSLDPPFDHSEVSALQTRGLESLLAQNTKAR